MLAKQDQFINKASETIYQLTQEEQVRLQCEAREDYYRRQRTIQYNLDKQKDTIESQNTTIENPNITIQQLMDKTTLQENKIISQENKITSQEDKITFLQKEIASLKQMLSDAGII